MTINHKSKHNNKQHIVLNHKSRHKPREDISTVAAIFSSATSLGMRLPVRLHGVPFRTLVALPLLLAMLAAEMLLDARKIAQRPRRVVVHAALLRAHVNPLPRLLAAPLLQLPW